jgi:hypothetical protein
MTPDNVPSELETITSPRLRGEGASRGSDMPMRSSYSPIDARTASQFRPSLAIKLSYKARSGTRFRETSPLRRDRRDSHTGDIRHRNPAREDKAGGSDIRSPGNPGKQGVPSRPMIHSPGNRDERGTPHRRDIHSPADPGEPGSRRRPGIRRPGDRGHRARPNSLDIHSSAADRLGLHSLDIRKQDTERRDIRMVGSRTRRPGSRNRYSVAAEA